MSILKFDEFLNEGESRTHNIRTTMKNVKSKDLMNKLCEYIGKYFLMSLQRYGLLNYRDHHKTKDVITFRQQKDIDENSYLFIFKFSGEGDNIEFLKNSTYVPFDFMLDKPLDEYDFFSLRNEFLSKLTLFIKTEYTNEINYDNENDRDVKTIRLTLYNTIITADKRRKDDELKKVILNT